MINEINSQNFHHPLEDTVQQIKSVEQFHYTLLKLFYYFAHKREHDNYNFRRFAVTGKDNSKVFETDRHIKALNWYFSRTQKLYESWNLLSDQTSKALFVELLLYRLLGHLHVRIHARALELAERLDEFNKNAKGEASANQVEGMFGSLVDYDFEWEGSRYRATLSKGGLAGKLISRQYFYTNGETAIQPEPGDHVIDGGACLGDTAAVFSNSVDERGKVYSFEPNSLHLTVLKKNIEQHPIKNIELFPCGLSNENIEADPVTIKENCDFGFSLQSAEKLGKKCPQARLDDLVESGRIERVDFIKLDIEGSELDALRGGLRTLKKYRPKLAISLYHKFDDFWELIEFLHNECPFYKFHIDHYTNHAEETVLYASA